MQKHPVAAPRRDCLVAVVTTDLDLARFTDQQWYRIPRRVLGHVLSSDALAETRWLALYQTGGVTSGMSGAIELIARVESVDFCLRSEIIPEEPGHPAASEGYAIVRVSAPERLPQPVIAKQPRRITFVRTTRERLMSAEDINDLFIGTPEEEALWGELRPLGAQRRCFVQLAEMIVEVDFALFHGDRALGVICGESPSTEIPGVHDATDWTLLRFSPTRIEKDLYGCVGEIVDFLQEVGRGRTDVASQS